jgi:UDP-N-acetylmuramate--alanine ligase
VTVSYGHAADHIGAAEVVVVSSAIRPENPEVIEAARRQVPVIPRAEMLAELMRLRFAVAVAGAHGKTTTTSMIAVVLERAGLDPTAVIGGRLSAFGSNARLGRGELMVAEADESDRSFLKLFPSIAVITNIDHEHLESYSGFADLQQAFVDFANRVPFYGAVVACADDANLREVLPRMTRRVLTYGLEAPAGVTAADLVLGPFTASATVLQPARAGEAEAVPLGRLELNVPGRHNVQNALAAVAVGLELGLTFERIASGLREFRGAERRFEVRGEQRGILVVDDYGHHPTEIAAVLSAARSLDRRVVVAFQPHRYTRTAMWMDAFGPALSGADHLILTDIYAAGETPIAGVTLDALASAIRRTFRAPLEVVPQVQDVPAALARVARRGDVVITLGAGSISGVADALILALTGQTRPTLPTGEPAS